MCSRDSDTWLQNNKKMLYLVSFLYVATLLFTQTISLDNGLARTPPMGWMSWERYRCVTDCKTYPESCINERLYMEMADRLSTDGWKELGYVSIHLDDCWMAKKRSSDGKLVGDAERFPHGMKALGDYIHSKGLKYGIYEDFGTKTCAGYPGSQFHLATDAQTFAEWGVDYLKLDGCNSNVSAMDVGYPDMGKYLNKTMRPIIYSCSWPDYLLAAGVEPDYVKTAKYCNLWRNFLDVEDNWDENIEKIIQYYAENQDTFIPVHGPGQWFDPDMLVIGDYGLSYEQQKSQMAMWCVLASPLIMSNDLRKVPHYAKEILSNKRLIAVNQDEMGRMGRRIYASGDTEIYSKAILPVGSYAVVFRRKSGAYPTKFRTMMKEIGLADSRGYHVTELFSGHEYGFLSSTDTFNCTLNPYGVVMISAVINTSEGDLKYRAGSNTIDERVNDIRYYIENGLKRRNRKKKMLRVMQEDVRERVELIL